MSSTLSAIPEITIRSQIRHPRLRYVLKIVGRDLGYRFRFHNEESVFANTPSPNLITYGGEGRYNLPAHPVLCGKYYEFPNNPGDGEVLDASGLPLLCPTPDGPDLLANIFVCLTRMEEYEDFAADAHGRFPAAASHAYRHGYLHRPVVREWTAELGRRLREWFPDLPKPSRPALQFQPTYDIDTLWAYRYRGWRGLASGLRDVLTGHLQRGWERFTASKDRDPFQTLSFLRELHERYDLRPTFFWLLSDRSHIHDTNPFPIPEEQKTWMRNLAGEADMGIHPSYLASDRAELVALEKERLERIIDETVTHSRQHFLRFRLPNSYRDLIAAGIRADHSMGYGDAIGWRAGTNLPFPWYDLTREKETRLVVHPFAAMDVTLRNYLDLSAEQAYGEIRRLHELAAPFGGPFVLLWHNSSFAPSYGWSGWQEMYERLIQQLTVESADPISA